MSASVKLKLPRRKTMDLGVGEFFLNEEDDLVLVLENSEGEEVQLTIPRFHAMEIVDYLSS